MTAAVEVGDACVKVMATDLQTHLDAGPARKERELSLVCLASLGSSSCRSSGMSSPWGLVAFWLFRYEVFVCESFALHSVDDLFHLVYRV